MSEPTVEELNAITSRLDPLVEWDISVVQYEPLLWRAEREGYKTQQSNDIGELVRRIWFEEDRVERRDMVR